MKYFIVGLHSSGKQQILDILSQMDIKCGKLFSNIPPDMVNIYNGHNYERFESMDCYDIFENNAYIFIHELHQEDLNFSIDRYYEGLSKYEFDNNEVFALSPDQLLSITPHAIKEDICYIWLDNTEVNRYSRYSEENRQYSFNEREIYEKQDISAFIKAIYNGDKLIYFTNEDPSRIATILYTIIKYPELLDLYVKNFN
jgi:hypothetical protein